MTQARPLKVLFLFTKNPYGPGPFGGAETSARLIGEYLADLGHEVVYSTMDKDRHGYRIAEQKGIVLEAFPAPPKLLRKMIPVLPGFVLTHWLTRLYRRWEPDIVYCYYERDILISAIRSRRPHGKPRVVLRMAGLGWYESIKRNPRRRTVYARCFSQVDAINFIHGGLEEMLRERFAEYAIKVDIRDKFVADIGTRMPRTTAPMRHVRNRNQFKIVVATRFTDYQKRQDILVRALAQIGEARNFFVTFVGQGAQRPVIESLTHELGISHCTQFLDFLPQSDLWDEISRADLLAHCTEYEGLGKIVVEAMAIGVPVLVSDVPVLNRYITDGKTGFLAENEPGTWAKRIAQIMDEPEICQSVAQSAKDFVEANFDPEQNVVRYEQEFYRIIGAGTST